jgi:polyhydroxyalkanoate synthase subunit PhaE
VWIDAAEEAWGEVANGPEYRGVYGRFVNAQMRLRGAVQKEIEQSARLLGLPTRSELDASHRKVAALERELRVLTQQVQGRAPSNRSAQAAAVDDAPARAAAAAKAPKPVTVVMPKAGKRPASKAPPRAAAAPRKNVLPQVTAPHAALRAAPATKAAAVKKSRPSGKRR